MPEARPGAGPPPLAARGELAYARFGGLLAGRFADREAIERAARDLDARGPVRAELELDGGRFSLLLGDEPLGRADWTPEVLQGFLGGLEDLMAACGDPASLESTLRCSEVYANEVVETLFVPEAGGHVRCVSSVRPRRPGDAPAAAGPPPASSLGAGMGPRRAAWVASLLLVAFALVAWSSGYLDRVFGAAADELEASAGDWGGLVELELERSWGSYAILLRRGPLYPQTADEARALEESAGTPAERAAYRALVDGGQLYVQLLDGEGDVLEVARVELAPLLTRADARVEAKLPARMAGRRVALSIEPGERP